MIMKPVNTEKTQIILHHTAGNAKPGAGGTIETAQGWSNRMDRVSTHVIIGLDGYTDYLYPDEYYGNNTAVGPDRRTLGIEIQSLGYMSKRNPANTDQFLSSYNPPHKLSKWIPGTDEKGWAFAVDQWHNPVPYKGHEAYQAYTDSQLKATIKVVEHWIRKHNIPFTYNYDILFPPLIPTTKYKAAREIFEDGTPGVYTHNSMQLERKSDIWPQAEMIGLLRQLALKLKNEGRAGCYGDQTPNRSSDD